MFDISPIPEREMPILGIYKVVHFVTNLGIEISDILASANINEADLENPNATVSRVQELKFMTNLLKINSDPLLGLKIGCIYRLSAFGDLGMALFSSKDGFTALDFIIRHSNLTYTYFDFHIEHTEKSVIVVITAPHDLGSLYAFFLLRDLAFVATAIDDVNFSTNEAVILKLDIALPKSEQTTLYDSIFGCDIEFEAPTTKIHLSKRILSTPMPMENMLTFKHYENLCDKKMEQHNNDMSLSEVILKIIINCDDNYPNETQLAEKLLMSTRTLRRRLDNEDTTYKKILQKFLHEKSKGLLTNTPYSIEKIATKLGYADATSFIRAFKNWEKKTPTAFRKKD